MNTAAIMTARSGTSLREAALLLPGGPSCGLRLKEKRMAACR